METQVGRGEARPGPTDSREGGSRTAGERPPSGLTQSWLAPGGFRRGSGSGAVPPWSPQRSPPGGEEQENQMEATQPPQLSGSPEPALARGPWEHLGAARSPRAGGCAPLSGGPPLASCHSHMSTFCLQPLLLPCPWTITWWEATQIFLVPPAPLTLAPRHQACVGQGRGLQSSLIFPCDAKARTWREGCPGCRPPCCLHHDGSCPPAIRDHTCLPSIHTCTSGPSVARHSYCWPTGIPAGAHTCARHSADPCSPHTVPKGRPPPLL